MASESSPVSWSAAAGVSRATAERRTAGASDHDAACRGTVPRHSTKGCNDVEEHGWLQGPSSCSLLASVAAVAVGHRERQAGTHPRRRSSSASSPSSRSTSTSRSSAARRRGRRRTRTCSVIYAQGKSATDDAGEIAAIQDMVASGVKGIAITPTSPAVIPALNKAVKAGVKVVLMDNDLPTWKRRRSVVATNNLSRRHARRQVARRRS